MTSCIAMAGAALRLPVLMRRVERRGSICLTTNWLGEHKSISVDAAEDHKLNDWWRLGFDNVEIELGLVFNLALQVARETFEDIPLWFLKIFKIREEDGHQEITQDLFRRPLQSRCSLLGLFYCPFRQSECDGRHGSFHLL